MLRPEHLHRLAVIAEIADAGSLSAAARRLGVVKSSVSHHVAELETEIGAKVLHRQGRGVVLTPIGEILAAHGRTIVKEGQHALLAAKEAEAPRGTMRISMPAGIADAWIIPMLADFLHRFPGLSLEVVATDAILDLAKERIDVAFRIGGVEDGPFIAHKLIEDRNIFVASPHYLAKMPPISMPADLWHHPLVGFAGFGNRQSFMLEALGGARTEVEMQCRLTTTSGLAIKQWAISGAGVARMPMIAVTPEIGRGELVHVLPGYTALEFTLFVIYMPERFRPANVRRLLEHAKAYFKQR